GPVPGLYFRAHAISHVRFIRRCGYLVALFRVLPDEVFPVVRVGLLDHCVFLVGAHSLAVFDTPIDIGGVAAAEHIGTKRRCGSETKAHEYDFVPHCVPLMLSLATNGTIRVIPSLLENLKSEGDRTGTQMRLVRGRVCRGSSERRDIACAGRAHVRFLTLANGL